MSLSQRRCSHRSLHKSKKSKVLAVVLSGYKSNEQLSWISHVKIINNQRHTKKKTIPMPWPYSLSITLKKHILKITILPHFVLQLSCCYQNSIHASIKNNHDFIWVPEIYLPYTFSRGVFIRSRIEKVP